MFGVEEYYYNLINEAKSAEEIYKIMEYQFVLGKGVPEDIFRKAFTTDPTKKKSYSRWLLNKWDNEKDTILELIENNDLKRLFEYFQARQNSGLNLTDFKTVDDAIGMLPEIDRVLDKVGDGGPEDDYEIVYDSPEWKIAVPNTYEASEKLGRGCRWCTAGAFRDGEKYFDRYTSQGPLWINFKMNAPETGPMDDKEYPYTRYQFCFESGDFRDSDDESIESFYDIGLPEEVKDFYIEKNHNYKEKLEHGTKSLEERWEDYMDERVNHSHCIKDWNENYLSIMPEWDSNYEFSENSPYYIFDENDEQDPISYDRIDVSEDYIAKDYNSSAVIVKADNEELIFCYLDSTKISYFQAIEDIDYLEDVGEFSMFVSYDKFYVFNHTSNIINFHDCKIKGNIVSYSHSNGLSIYESNEVFDKEHSYIEILLHDGTYDLLRYCPEIGSGGTLQVICSNDKPVGEHFSVRIIDGKPHVLSVNMEYDISDESNFKNYVFIRNLNEECAIVDSKDNTGYNVYNKEKRIFLFDTNQERILALDDNFCNFIAVRNAGFAYIYDIKLLRKITPSYDELTGQKFCDNYFLFGSKNNLNGKSVIDIYKYETNNLNKIATFENYKELNRTCHAVDTSEYRVDKVFHHFYDYYGNEILPEFEEIENWNKKAYYGKFLNNNSLFIYDLCERKMILNGITNKGETTCFHYFQSNNKDCFLPKYYYRGIIMVDKILTVSWHWLAAVRDGGLYFFDNEGSFCPENGFDYSVVNEIKTYENQSDVFNIIAKNGETVDYIPSRQKFIKFNEQTHGFENVDNSSNEVVRLLTRQGLNEVKKRFNDYFDRINDVKF